MQTAPYGSCNTTTDWRTHQGTSLRGLWSLPLPCLIPYGRHFFLSPQFSVSTNSVHTAHKRPPRHRMQTAAVGTYLGASEIPESCNTTTDRRTHQGTSLRGVRSPPQPCLIAYGQRLARQRDLLVCPIPLMRQFSLTGIFL